MTPEKKQALIITTVVHVLMLILFMIIGLTELVPRVKDGVMIDLGTSLQGMGNQPSENPTMEAAAAASQTEPQQEAVAEPTQPVTDPVVDDPVMTQEQLEAIALQEQERKEEQRRLEEEAEAQRQREADEAERRAKEEAAAATKSNFSNILKGAQNGDDAAQGGGGQGNTGQPGDYGDPNGTPGGAGNGPAGTGGSNGQFSLVGRKSLRLGEPRPPTPREGVVVVDIVVDQNGKVISAMPGAQGTTITDKAYLDHCKRAAMASKFSAHPTGEPRQRGSITFRFKLQ